MTTRRSLNNWQLVALWVAGSSAAGALIGLAVGMFQQEGVEAPTVVISVLFGNVVGISAMICGVLLFPRLRALPPTLRFLLLALALLSGAVIGSVAVLNVYPLFVFRQPWLAAAVVAVNGTLALIVGSVVYAYEVLRQQLQESLREVEEVRLVEAQLREEAARAEIAALQARINPHFFFNTLNTITSLIDDDPEEAGEVCQSLADLFRYTFKAADAGPVGLEEEVTFIRGYLAIEQARFGERLRVVWDLQPDALEAKVPGLILQPLVENAVAHGIAPLARGGTLRVSAAVDDGMLKLEVSDDGVGLREDPSALIEPGHGLGNVRARLETLYRGDAVLAVRRAPSGSGTVARLTLPLKRGEDKRHELSLRRHR